MIKNLIVIMVMLILILALVLNCTPEAQPTTPADFYKGKTINLVISASPGGTIDLTSRIIASYLGQDTMATVVVTNRSGGGGLEGINYLYKSKPDGLTLGTTPSDKFVSNKVLDEPAAAYDIGNFSYIMSIGRELNYFYVSPEGPYQSVTDLQVAKGLKIGGSSPSGSIALGGLLVIKLLGLDAKVITGFEGEPNRTMAVKRGEIAGYCQDMSSIATAIEAGLLRPMFVLATERDPLMPEVPAITELVSLTDDDLLLVRLWETAFVSSRILAASPDIPEDRLTFLQSLAEKWVHDEGFCKDINAVSSHEVQEYKTGDEVTRAMLDTAAALDRFQSIFAELIKKYRA